MAGGQTDEQDGADPFYSPHLIFPTSQVKVFRLLKLRASASHFVYAALLCWTVTVGSEWGCRGNRGASEVTTLLPGNQGCESDSVEIL